jgi:hypothetical protein
LAWRLYRRRPQRSTDRTSGAARAFIGRMGLFITCLTMFGPPAIYAAWTLYGLKQWALQFATVGARHLEAQLSLQLSHEPLSQAASNVLQATSIASSAAVASWVTNSDGKLMYFQGGQANGPERTVSAPIHAFRFDGHLYVALSTREVFVNTCGGFAAFLLLGLAANYYFRRLPLLALDQALRQRNAKQEALLLQKAELETQNERLEAALNNMSQGAFAVTTASRSWSCAMPATCTCMGWHPNSPCPARRWPRSSRIALARVSLRASARAPTPPTLPKTSSPRC